MKIDMNGNHGNHGKKVLVNNEPLTRPNENREFNLLATQDVSVGDELGEFYREGDGSILGDSKKSESCQFNKCHGTVKEINELPIGKYPPHCKIYKIKLAS